ncbi:MAG: hypothetical protein U1E93_08835 [Alphaproteobacteria bacterium]
MTFLEPKDPVRLRWLGEQVRGGQFAKAFMALDSWMLSTAAALAVGLLLALVLLSDGETGYGLAALAMLGFLVRDVAIFVAARALAGNKGDFAALAVLGVLYMLMPTVLRGLDLYGLRFLFLPVLEGAGVLSVPTAWAQGLVALAVAWRSIQKSFTS